MNLIIFDQHAHTTRLSKGYRPSHQIISYHQIIYQFGMKGIMIFRSAQKRKSLKKKHFAFRGIIHLIGCFALRPEKIV